MCSQLEPGLYVYDEVYRPLTERVAQSWPSSKPSFFIIIYCTAILKRKFFSGHMHKLLHGTKNIMITLYMDIIKWQV